MNNSQIPVLQLDKDNTILTKSYVMIQQFPSKTI